MKVIYKGYFLGEGSTTRILYSVDQDYFLEGGTTKYLQIGMVLTGDYEFSLGEEYEMTMMDPYQQFMIVRSTDARKLQSWEVTLE